MPERNRYLGESDSEIGEDNCNDLEGTAAQTSGAQLHRSRDDVADAKRHVADVEARSDGEGSIAGEADSRGADKDLLPNEHNKPCLVVNNQVSPFDTGIILSIKIFLNLKFFCCFRNLYYLCTPLIFY